ncbi:Transposase IS4 [Popillia japonica]|uniref:Transposase IS4 n=1 Tax=Popillia japonica TaxID=7064 RepID=A0AAW1IFF1_POPJA
MDNYSYWKRPLKLHEIIEELEQIDDEINVPDSIVIFPPENANEENTDEDSGDEDMVDINNLPGSQLRSEVEVFSNGDELLIQTWCFHYWKRPLKLHEIIEELEQIDDEINVPDSIVIFPPENANEENTDEDSGDEDMVDINNLPGSQLRSEVEVFSNGDELESSQAEYLSSDNFDSEDDLPLSLLIKRSKIVQIPSKSNWVREDLVQHLPEWNNSDTEKCLFFVEYSNQYATSHNRPGDISSDEICSFLGILLLSGYVCLPRREMYWENSKDTKNDVVSGAMSRNRFRFVMQNLHCSDNDEIIHSFVEYSNQYATSHNRPGDISSDEICSFLGILLLSGYVCLPRREMYWENSKDTKNDVVSGAMSRNRFRFVMQNLHCSDNTKLNPADKFSKVRPLFEMLNKRFIELAPNEEHHSVDESMVPYFGRHGTKQFIKGKPIRWGYKFWCGTTRLGYIEWFDAYQGSSTTISHRHKNLGLGASVVLQFAEVLQKKTPNIPYDLYFDNFVTSIKLLHQLKCMGMKGTGTIRENCVEEGCKLPHSISPKDEKTNVLAITSIMTEDGKRKLQFTFKVVVSPKDEKTNVLAITSIMTEDGKRKKNLKTKETKQEWRYKNEEKKPCKTCENLNKGARYHPEDKCWFKTKPNITKERPKTMGNNAVIEVRMLLEDRLNIDGIYDPGSQISIINSKFIKLKENKEDMNKVTLKTVNGVTQTSSHRSRFTG